MEFRICSKAAFRSGQGACDQAPASQIQSGLLMLFHPLSICIDKALQERLDRFRQLARLIERRPGTAQVSLGLLHQRHIEKNHGLTQVMVGAETANRARRNTDHRARFATPGALAVRARADIDGVFHRRRHRTVVFRSDEQHRVG
ncbi:hypothetical protein D3C86_1760960 [compost metagenome]